MEDWLKKAMDETKEKLEKLKGELNDRKSNK